MSKLPLLLATPLVLTLLATGLEAQIPPADPEGEPRSEGEAPVLPVTLVTARKWPEDPEKLPQSLFVLDEAALRDAGIATVRDASLRVPNLLLTEFSSRRLSFPTLRGIGSGQGDPAVTTYIGGVPQLTTSSTNIPLIDVERVEFLRGPQSTLYGRNALGGVIHVVPKLPGGTTEAEGSLELGNHDLRELQLAAGGPVHGDELLMRVAAMHTRRDGYTTNDHTGNQVDHRDSFFGRASMLWFPGDQWEVQLAIHGERSRDGGFVLSDLEGLRQRPHHIDQDFEGEARRDILAPSLSWTWYGDDLELTSISGYQDWEIHESSDFDFSSQDWVRRTTDESQRYFNQELRAASPEEEDAAWRWLLGLNYFSADSWRAAANEFRVDEGGGPPPRAPAGTDVSEGDFDDWGLAAFGQVTFALAEDLDLGLGLRLDHEAKTADLNRHSEGGRSSPGRQSTHGSEEYDEVLPQLSLAWQAAENVLAYARAAQGFKAGGFNLAAPSDQHAFGPESSWTWEVGAKSAWLEERLRLKAALFYVDWRDMQLSLFDSTVGGYVDNAGAATSRGFELELEGEPRDGLALFGGFGFTDARFEEYVDPFGANVGGNTLAFAPRTTGSLGARLSGGPGEEDRWSLQASLVNVGTFYYDAGNRESESYSLLDLRAGVEGTHWRFDLWVRNALDENYVPVAFQPNPLDPSAFVGESGAPLTFGVSLTAGF